MRPATSHYALVRLQSDGEARLGHFARRLPARHTRTQTPRAQLVAKPVREPGAVRGEDSQDKKVLKAFGKETSTLTAREQSETGLDVHGINKQKNPRHPIDSTNSTNGVGEVLGTGTESPMWLR